MKKLLLFASLLALMTSVSAQISNEELELVRSIVNSERKVFFAQNMELSSEQFTAFWTLYDKYEQESKALMSNSISQIKTLINESDNISDEELDQIQKTTFKRRKKLLSLQNKYYKIMKKEFGTKAASRFLQIDRFVDATVKSQLFGEMPLIKSN
jgi:hypothetical protein